MLKPNLLACTLLLARSQDRPVLLDKMSYLHLLLMLEGVIYESGTDAWVRCDEWVDEGLAALRSDIHDRLPLSRPHASVALIEHARSMRQLHLVRNGQADAWELLSSDRGVPPQQEVFDAALRIVDPAENRRRVMNAQGRLDRLTPALRVDSEGLAAAFRVPVGFSRSNVVDGYLSALGAVASTGAELVTDDRRFYRQARSILRDVYPDQPAQVETVRRATKTSAFARAFEAEPASTSVFDVLHVLEDLRKYESLKRLFDRMQAQAPMRADVGAFLLSQSASTLYPPAGWIVNAGRFVIRFVRRPR